MATYDIVIKGGTVIDGLRTPRYKADVAIKDGTIVQIGRIDASEGAELSHTRSARPDEGTKRTRPGLAVTRYLTHIVDRFTARPLAASQCTDVVYGAAISHECVATGRHAGHLTAVIERHPVGSGGKV